MFDVVKAKGSTGKIKVSKMLETKKQAFTAFLEHVGIFQNFSSKNRPVLLQDSQVRWYMAQKEKQKQQRKVLKAEKFRKKCKPLFVARPQHHSLHPRYRLIATPLTQCYRSTFGANIAQGKKGSQSKGKQSKTTAKRDRKNPRNRKQILTKSFSKACGAVTTKLDSVFLAKKPKVKVKHHTTMYWQLLSSNFAFVTAFVETFFFPVAVDLIYLRNLPFH